MSKHTVQSALNWVPNELKFLLKGEVRRGCGAVASCGLLAWRMRM